MTLKNYIGLKFIWTILFLVLAYFSTIHVGNKYEELKKENKELQEQKKYYEQILKLKPENIEGKKNLYDYIQVSDHYLKKEKSENSPEFGTYILIMLFLPHAAESTRQTRLQTGRCWPKQIQPR